MGVVGLWSILKDAEKIVSLEELRGKVLAVDLSCWIFESKQAELSSSRKRKPYLWLIFHRTRQLLQHGAKLVFVTEGKVPELKGDELLQRSVSRQKYDLERGSRKTEDAKPGSVSRRQFDYTLRECQKLLESLGTAVIRGAGEAEATCAYLNRCRIVDGCLTEDSDAFLYGGRAVYREISIKDKVVKEYLMDDIEERFMFDRRQLVALALLLGCDYDKEGVPGVGREKAMELIRKLQRENVDVLERFESWKTDKVLEGFDFLLLNKAKRLHCLLCGHPGNEKKHSASGCDYCKTSSSCSSNQESSCTCPCEWHKVHELKERLGIELFVRMKAQEKQGFPSQEIIDEYLKYSDVLPREAVRWRMPNWIKFKDIIQKALRWDEEKSWSYFLPLFTSWKLQNWQDPDAKSCSFITPERILKECTRKGKACYEVEWKMSPDFSGAQMQITTENRDAFEAAHPQIAKKFCRGNSQSKSRKRRFETLDKNQKTLDQTMVPRSPTTPKKAAPREDAASEPDVLIVEELPQTPKSSRISSPKKRLPKTPKKTSAKKLFNECESPEEAQLITLLVVIKWKSYLEEVTRYTIFV